MDIAILGGSFDPPHVGHTAIAKDLLRLRYADQIWLVPCYKHPFNKNLTPSNKRLEMTKYLEEKLIKISDYEIKNKKTSYTIDTLKFLVKKYPKNKFSLVIGTDQIKDFTKWKNWQEIINNFKLIIIPRTGVKSTRKELAKIKKQVEFPRNILLIDKEKFPPIDISSTLIREQVKKNKAFSRLVPKEIEKYIIKHRLYK
jgi:nicotinate-nucleotide adenylyltransferase